MKRIFNILLIAAIVYNSHLSFFNSLHAQDAEYNLIRRTYKVNADGTTDIGFRKEIKLLRNRAITAYADKGETFILYNPATEKLIINESYTIRKDGSRVQTPSNAFVEQLPSQCQNCGRYNGIREMAVIHTALEYDCIIVLDYTIHREGTYLDEKVIFSEDCPVKKYEVIVDATDVSSTLSGVKDLQDGHSLHIVATGLSQKYIDSYLPSATELYPYLRFTCGKRPVDLTESEKLPQAQNIVSELYDHDPLKYATNIRDYVFDNINTTDFPLSLVGYRTSTASETFSSNCGTPADKKRLTAAMLREAGFAAEERERDIAVTLKEEGRDMTYILSTTGKRSARLDGAAIDEQRTITVVDTLPWTGSVIGGGYKQMTLPAEREGIAISPAQLTSTRKAPLKVRNCNESYQYLILLPRTPKHLLAGEPVDINYKEKGIGSIRISIKQNPGGGIEVTRELTIDVENGIVTAKQYKAFRKMMQDWDQYRTIVIKAQPGRPISQ